MHRFLIARQRWQDLHFDFGERGDAGRFLEVREEAEGGPGSDAAAGGAGPGTREDDGSLGAGSARAGNVTRGANVAAVGGKGASSGEEKRARRYAARGGGREGRAVGPSSDAWVSGPVFPELAEGVVDIGGATTGEDAADDCEVAGTGTRSCEVEARGGGSSSPIETPGARRRRRRSSPRTRSGASSSHSDVAKVMRRSRASTSNPCTSPSSSKTMPAGPAKEVSSRCKKTMNYNINQEAKEDAPSSRHISPPKREQPACR